MLCNDTSAMPQGVGAVSVQCGVVVALMTVMSVNGGMLVFPVTSVKIPQLAHATVIMLPLRHAQASPCFRSARRFFIPWLLAELLYRLHLLHTDIGSLQTLEVGVVMGRPES
jgi:hypothetical protein